MRRPPAPAFLPVLAMLAGAPTARPLAAQVPAAAQAPTGRIAGVVHDSLLGAPLAQATVFLEGSTRMAVSGADGRFTLDSVAPGTHALTASHPTLDALGLPAPSARVEVAAGATASATLATPPRARVVAALCGGRAPAGGGVLFGAVSDAAGGQRLAGAVVVARFIAPAEKGARGAAALAAFMPVERGARADSLGEYALCDVPPAAELRVRARAGADSSGAVLLTLGARGVARLDLTLGRAAASTAPLAAALRGEVRDSAGRPARFARVQVDERPDLAILADSLGRFRLEGLAAGTRTLFVTAVGLAPQAVAVQLRPGDANESAIVLQRVRELPGVRVRGRRDPQAGFRAQLEQRRREGQAFFVDAATIQQLGGVRAALTSVPTLKVTGSPAQWELRMSHDFGCRPTVYVDGRALIEGYQELASLPPEWVVAIEVHQRPSTAPPRYPALYGKCGVVLVWTISAR